MDDISPFEPTVLGAMRKYWWLVILIVVAITALAIVYAFFSPVSYQATANLVVEDPQTGNLFDIGIEQRPERYVADQAAILGSAVLADRAAAAEDSLDDAETVLEGLDVLWGKDSNLIQAVFTSDDPESAIAGANAVASTYSELRLETTSASFSAALLQLDDSIADVETQITDLQRQIELVLKEDPARISLDTQLSEALFRLVEIQEELPDATGTRLDELRAELDDILQQIQTLQNLGSLDAQNPQLTLLMEEQRQTVSRKADLLQTKDELSVEARMESTGIVLYSPAITSEEVGADLRRLGAVGLMLGVLLAASTAYLLALRKRTFDERSQPELVLHIPLLAEVPNFRAERIKGELPVKNHPASVSAEAFRFISAALDIETEQTVSTENTGTHLNDAELQPVRSFVVVSPNLGDGKTIVVANTALASARQGKRVLAVDADFGHQKLSVLLTGEDAPTVGLTDLVERGVPFHQVAHRIPLQEGSTLDLVVRGTVAVSAPDFFRSSAVRAFFEAVRDEYDLVVIDTPPLLHVAYAGSLVRYADRAVVVASHRGNVAPAEDLADRLAFLETEVMGYVYNKAPLRDDMTRSEGSLEDVLGQSLPTSKRD